MTVLWSLLVGLFGFLLLGAAGASVRADDGTLVIHPSVWAGYQEYDKLHRPGAFAVSRDGSTYGYSYCPEARCTFNTAKKIALESCTEGGGVDCLVFAVQRDIKVAYHVLDVATVGACPTSPVPEVTIVADIPPAVYDYSYDVAGLTDFGNRGRARGGEVRFETLGLTIADYDWTTRPAVEATILNENGTICVGIAPGEIRFPVNVYIYVASEFRKGTCMYEEILAHEERHHEVDRRLYTEYAADATRRLAKDLRARPFIAVPDASMAQSAVAARVNQAMEDALVVFAQRYESEQSEIDTYSEYNRIANACSAAREYID